MINIVDSFWQNYVVRIL